MALALDVVRSGEGREGGWRVSVDDEDCDGVKVTIMMVMTIAMQPRHCNLSCHTCNHIPPHAHPHAPLSFMDCTLSCHAVLLADTTSSNVSMNARLPPCEGGEDEVAMSTNTGRSHTKQCHLSQCHSAYATTLFFPFIVPHPRTQPHRPPHHIPAPTLSHQPTLPTLPAPLTSAPGPPPPTSPNPTTPLTSAPAPPVVRLDPSDTVSAEGPGSEADGDWDAAGRG